jgi:hypothetical protein
MEQLTFDWDAAACGPLECKVCGRPIRRNNKSGLCNGKNSPPCRRARDESYRQSAADSPSWPTKAAFLAAHLDERLARRFWTKVNKNGPVPPHRPELGPCWVWTKAKDKKGYGYFSVGAAAVRKTFCAHRVAMALSGEVPADDLEVCHHCDNPQCVRPDHLFIGTRADNCADMATKGRGRKPLAVCGKGHALAGANVRVTKRSRGGVLRVCVTCDLERQRKWQQQYNAVRKARRKGAAA